MSDTTAGASRSAFLELKDERQLVREGYEFLDEKRMILAQEMLRRLREYEAAEGEYAARLERANGALARAVGRHGLDGLGIYPVLRMEAATLTMAPHRFLGVRLVDGRFDPGPPRSQPPAVNPSPEAEACRAAWEALVPLAVELGVMRGSLLRLVHEYVRTERRARALENVLLPEIEGNLRQMDEQLEAMDQEEAVRVRNAGHH